jgi:hypothetical protein
MTRVGILSDLLNFKHRVSPDLTLLKQKEMITWLMDIIDCLALLEHHSVKVLHEVSSSWWL